MINIGQEFYAINRDDRNNDLDNHRFLVYYVVRIEVYSTGYKIGFCLNPCINTLTHNNTYKIHTIDSKDLLETGFIIEEKNITKDKIGLKQELYNILKSELVELKNKQRAGQKRLETLQKILKI